MKIAYIRPDMGVPANDPSLIREVDQAGTTLYRNSEGKLHRESDPAVERTNGTRIWYRAGTLHREDGPAVEYTDGTRQWYRDGVRHREDGPAYEYADGSRSWYLNGLLHREDGPAIEDADGTRSWYRNGERLSEEEFEARKPRFSSWASFKDLRR